ncbi:hypothetical protein CFC21_099481 [Triticum aestivum]|uniref:F-box associated domain-containing protein n=2 Tax=Triticum aestivum TaxID=4565 RepID=A0A9R1N1X8_WHEAT|nr:hypothetical protein CFC21_099481 [Triticum aestivum]
MNFSVPGGLVNGFIQHSQGRLHYVNFQMDEDGGVNQLVVYVLENYQSKEWTLKHSVETSYILGMADYCIYWFDWIAVHPECNLIFFTLVRDLKLMCYNMDCRQVKVICNLEGVEPPYLPYVPLYAELEALCI